MIPLLCVARAMRMPPRQGVQTPQAQTAVAEPRPDAVAALRRNDFGDLHAFLRSFDCRETLADVLEPLALPDLDRIVDRAALPPAQLADTGACLQLMAAGDFLGAHDVCEGLVEKGAGAGDAARSCAFAVVAALCEAELTGTYAGVWRGDLARVVLDDAATQDPRSAPFVDLALSFTSDAATALGCALAAAAASPDLGDLASVAARKADEKRAAVDVEEEAPVEVEEAAPLPKALSALDDLVAIAPAKQLFAALTDAGRLAEERQDDLRETSFSAVFSGNPGTGKSTVMKLYGALLEELKVAPKDKTIETTGGELARGGTDGFEELVKKSFADPQTSLLEVGDRVEVKRGAAWGHFGEVVFVDRNTYDVRSHDFVEIKAPRHRIKDAREEGGVLLVDEAYQLDPANSQAGRQVLEMLVREMDLRQGSLTVVFAGPSKDMDSFISSTPGLPSRVRRTIDFPDFSDDELVEVARRKFDQRFGNYELADAKHLRIAARRLGKGRGAPGFGNARAIAHLIDNAWERQTRRVSIERLKGLDPDPFRFTREDLLGNRTLDMTRSEPLQALQAMEGLDKVKHAVDDLLRIVETNNEREDNEEPPQQFSLNRVFLGNPGTGKTTVARLYGRVLNELGFLSKGGVVLATPSDFVGSALGQSEEKTNALLDKARGCVLVIDEAYGLDPAQGNGGIAGGDPFRGAVVDALVSRVQGEAGADVCVLLLGYERPMRAFLRTANLGLARRFDLENAFVFEDYDDQALLKILLQNVKARNLVVTLPDAKAAVRKRLAKQRLRPNFGNAGAAEALVAEAVQRRERRLDSLTAAERVLERDLLLEDLYEEPAHVKDPSLVFDGLIGCQLIKQKLAEYSAVVDAARLVGRDPMEDLGMVFAFQGAPGTGKTTVARRMGLLFEALGVLPSSDVVQVSASDFVTGYVGQAAGKTRDIFESARGAVLFIDEAYRLYDPTGRSYFQEAIDEIVTLLTEEDYKNKMVVVFAGYSNEMSTLLAKVNPGLKSRVSDVIDFPDFDASDAAAIAANLLVKKRMGSISKDLLRAEAQKLVSAPDWANGRDVDAWVRRIAVEAATRGSAVATEEAVRAATEKLLLAKRGAVVDASPEIVDASSFLTADMVIAPPRVEVQTVADAREDEDDDDDEPAFGAPDLNGALEEACVALGYGDPARRAELTDALSGGSVPDDIVAHVVANRGGDRPNVARALAQQAAPFRDALLRAAIATKLGRKNDEGFSSEPGSDGLTEEDIVQRLREMGPCPMGFAWHREGGGWRCGGGSHFVHDDDPMLQA